MKITPALLLALLLSALPAYSQLSSGSVLGTVSDSTGAVIPGVSIKVTNMGTGQARDAVTNESGNYRVDLLPPGDYQVEAELSGFRKGVRRGIIVSIDARTRIDFTLVVGEVSEVVNVEGQAPLVQTDNSNIGQVVEERKIVALPLNGREFSQLAYIVPGAYAPRPNSQLGYRGGFEIAGGHENQNQFLLDGINNNANWTSEISARVNIDAVGEFKVQTSSYGAQYGRYAGAQVDAITKSGTNELHGSAFFFHRNDNLLGARNFFDPYPLAHLPEFRRHQFGAVGGGPIIKNKTFFFVGYAGQRQAQFRTLPVSLPLPEFWEGDLSKAGGTIRDPATNQPFPGNIIPKNRISPIALGLKQFWPLPTKAGLVQNATSYLESPDNYNQANARVDHQLTAAQKLSLAWTYYNEDLLEYLGSPTFSPFQVKGAINSFNLSLGHVFTISSTIVNEFRIGAAHLYRGRFIQDEDGTQNWNKVLGIACCTQADIDRKAWGVPRINITGISGIGNNYPIPQPRGETNFTVLDNISIQRSNHALKFGGDFFKMFNNSIQVNDGRGTFTFNGSRTGNPMADFLLGLPNQTQRQVSLGPGTSNSRRNSLDLFFQDDWKVSSKLTLNLGLRYEANWAMHDKYGMIARFDPSLGNGQGGFIVTPNHPRFEDALKTFKSYYPAIVIQDGPYLKDDLNNVAPRIGLAFRPFASTNTVVRGGYGFFYQMPDLGQNTGTSSAAPPWVLRQRLTTTDGITLANPWGAAQGSTISASSGTYIRPNLYVGNWNLDIQREMPGGWVLDLSYQGKRATSSGSYDINQPRDRTTGIRPFRNFSTLNYTDYTRIRHTSYNGLHVRSEKRSSHGLTYLISYMWGKDIEEGSPQDSYAPGVERRLSSEDVRHRFTLSFVYELPFGRDRKFMNNVPRVFDYVLGGWELSGISRANSGHPFTATISTDVSGTGNLNDRPNRIGNLHLGKAASPAAWWDKNAFATPVRYTFGNAGFGTLTGPSYWTQDFAIMKVLRPAENQRVQIRVEVFNAFNHANFDDPATTWNSTNFGTVRAAFDPRQIQLGIKWIF